MHAPTPAGFGLILFAHGARDPRWSEPFERVAAAVRRQRPDVAVKLAFLEFMAPDLPAAAAALVQDAGCTRLQVLPMFLGVGGHVRKDLPALLQQVREANPGVALDLLPAVGEMDAVVAAMAGAAVAHMGSVQTGSPAA
jgi:sirohydrochlorin cobaltochelatase